MPVPHTTSEIQKAVDAGGTIIFPPGTYEITQTIVLRKSNTVIQGSGPGTIFVFKPGLPQVQCANDRAFTTSQLFADVITGKLSPRVASTLTPLLNLLLRAIETVDLERRIANVEKVLASADELRRV